MAAANTLFLVGSFFTLGTEERNKKAVLRSYLGHYLVCVPEKRRLLRIVADTTDERLARTMVRSLTARHG